MRNTVCVLLALVLATLCWPAAAANVERLLESGKIFNTWGQALRESSLDLNQPIKGTPIAYENGVAVYRVEGLEDGAVDFTLVALPFNPTEAPAEVANRPGELDRAAAGEPAPMSIDNRVTYSTGGSSRCIIYAYRNEYYSTLLLITDLDWNDLSSYSGLNDSFDSLQTTCNGAFFFQHKNWGGSYLYLNSSVSVPVLSTYGFHDTISSLFHDLP